MNQENIVTTSKDVVEGQIKNFIIHIVQSYLEVSENYHTRKTRKREIVFARQVAMYLIKKHTKLSLKKIGEYFGGKDHATVLHSVKTIDNLMEVDRQIKATVKDIDKIVTFKNNTVSENLNLYRDYYYIDLSSFVSMKLLGDKSIVLSGFTPEEVNDFRENIKGEIELKSHKNTGMYILEKREKNDGEDGAQQEK
jgi:hypothetical protein